MPDITGDDDGNLVITVGDGEQVSVFNCAGTAEFAFTENAARVRLHSLTHPWFEDWVDLNLDDFRRERPDG